MAKEKPEVVPFPKETNDAIRTAAVTFINSKEEHAKGLRTEQVTEGIIGKFPCLQEREHPNKPVGMVLGSAARHTNTVLRRQVASSWMYYPVGTVLDEVLPKGPVEVTPDAVKAEAPKVQEGAWPFDGNNPYWGTLTLTSKVLEEIISDTINGNVIERLNNCAFSCYETKEEAQKALEDLCRKVAVGCVVLLVQIDSQGEPVTVVNYKNFSFNFPKG